MNEDKSQTLKNSADGEELATAALALARSGESSHHQTLFKFLSSESFLNRLDSAEEYKDLTRKLRLRRVLEALRDNAAAAPSAREILVKLVSVGAITGHELRCDILIAMLAVLRPAPPSVVEFWEAHAEPNDGFTPLTIKAVVENGDETALAVLEKKMFDKTHDDLDKIGWMRSNIITHRNDAPLLQSCRRLIEGTWKKFLKIKLVEVLFDYRPEEWYTPHVFYSPPERREADATARKELRRIGDYAMGNLLLSPELKTRVLETLKEL